MSSLPETTLRPRFLGQAKVGYCTARVAMACFGLIASPVWAQGKAAQALSEKNVIDMLESGETRGKIVQQIQSLHISFIMTTCIASDLTKYHHASPEVIAALEKQPKPNPGSSDSNQPVQPCSPTNMPNAMAQLLSGEWTSPKRFSLAGHRSLRDLHLDRTTHDGTYHIEILDRNFSCIVDYDLRLDHVDQVEATFWGTVKSSNWSDQCRTVIGDTGGASGARIIVRAATSTPSGVSLSDDNSPPSTPDGAPPSTTDGVSRTLLAVHEPFIHSAWITLIPDETPGK